MKAILHQRYGRPDVLELRDVDKPTIGDEQVLVRVHASSVNPVEWYGVSGPYFARIGNGMRRPKDQTVGADLAGTVEAVGRDVKAAPTGRRGVRRLGRVVGRVHDRARGPAREEALEPVVRGSGGSARGRGHGAPGAARQGSGAAGAEGARQRRLGRRRHVRGPARQAVRRRGDRRLQHRKRGAGPVAGRGPCGRLHERGLHEARRAARPDARHRRQPLVPRLQKGADPGGDRRPDRRPHDVSRPRPAAASRRHDPEVARSGARR